MGYSKHAPIQNLIPAHTHPGEHAGSLLRDFDHWLQHFIKLQLFCNILFVVACCCCVVAAAQILCYQQTAQQCNAKTNKKVICEDKKLASAAKLYKLLSLLRAAGNEQSKLAGNQATTSQSAIWLRQLASLRCVWPQLLRGVSNAQACNNCITNTHTLTYSSIYVCRYDKSNGLESSSELKSKWM